MTARQLERLAPWVVVIALFALWEFACRAFNLPEFILPAPSVAFGKLLEFREAIWGHALQTLFTTLVGFAIAVIVGLFLGVLVGYSRLVYAALYPVMVGFNSVPKAALVPILVIWFGIGTVPAILSAFLISFFPIVVNVATGLATVEPELQDVLRSLGAKRFDIFLKVGLPRSLPYFFASLKVSITLAFVGSVVSEIAASNAGIGYLMISASSRSETALLFAGLLVIAAMGVVFYELFAFLERRLTGWAYRGK
jgi:NitT/TauT family transport system permease protein